MTPSRRTQLSYQHLGKCIQCGKRRPRTATLCRECASKHASATKGHAHQLIDQQLCTQCSQPRDDPDRRYCAPCREIHNLRNQERRAERRRQGLCTDCGKPAGKTARCATCLAREQKRIHG